MWMYKLRPHHALCTAFFVGEGYSSDFTANMGKVTEMLRTRSPEIKLTCGWDIICKDCPHSSGGCGEKALRFDRAVLDICGLTDSQELNWSELSVLVREKILSAGKLAEVCGDCQWYSLCSSMK